ncbi:MAG: carbamoyltransferase HypF [Nitrospiraceae bacterium]|nr:carbamoyltransferase HypF [Nitrospiraceae bacterium]
MRDELPLESLRISVKGIVQGVGFRPFVYKLATGMGLKGFVTNNAGGVEIAVEGAGLGVFVDRLRAEAPPLSKILSVDIAFAGPAGFPDFAIRESEDTGRFTLISPDISVCDDCLCELFDPRNRRYLYPFINCTNCGPRYSITRSVPYDRPNTTMRTFTLCEDCMREYGDPGDRRFHAQPNACPSCGPQVSLTDSEGRDIGAAAPITAAIQLLKEGKILAIKGLGGFHLACDACNPDAVSALRARKRRSNKPFALMAPDIGAIRHFAHVSTEEETLLESGGRPIVLLKKKEACMPPGAVSPKNACLGFMLPYTPLHYLLFNQPVSGREGGPHFNALVMTSGNITEEPLVIDNDEAVSKLRGLADAFLLHDRDICTRVDDSVVRVRREQGRSVAAFVRRSRGYVPEPVVLGGDGPDVMGCGADLKNTFALTRGGYAIVSQHIGDMENYATLGFYEETLKKLKAVYRAEPVALAHDLHPGYLSTRWALEQPLRLFGIQHHYAHIGSVMAEHALDTASGGKVLGISFDGTGYGEDGNLWGGEFLLADTAGFTRAGHISYFPLPGGERAIKQPWRIAAAMINGAAGDDAWDYLRRIGFVEKYGEGNLDTILRISGDRTFSPLSSGAGRVFDAVAALAGICDENTFEGEAAIALEALVVDGINEAYPVDVILHDKMEIDFCMTFLSVIADLERHADRRLIATKFHNTVVSAILNVAVKLSSLHNISRVALSGGVFQNNYLLSRVIEGLSAERITVYSNEQVPCNDAGISLGQAYIIRERLKAETTR